MSRQKRARFVHPSSSLAAECGVTYGVRYIGCVPVLSSTRSLKTEVRNGMTRAAIRICCESAGLIMPDRKLRVKGAVKHLGSRPNMQYSGWSVNITMTTECISIVSMETRELIARHDLACVSFASGGDPDTMDFVAYVANDALLGRACHVIECPGGLASDVVATMGQAFELRHRQLDFSWNSVNRRPELNKFRERPKSSCNFASSIGRMLAGGSTNSLRSLSLSEACSAEPVDAVWYHGGIDRRAAETRLTAPGDFLVRSSQPGQYVLSCRLACGRCQHLLLLDSDGRLRTRNRTFDSIEQLVAYHLGYRLPIISTECEMLLLRAVCR